MVVRFGVASASIVVLVSFVAPAAAQTQGSCLIQKKRSRTEQKMAVLPEAEVPPQGSAHSRFSQLRQRTRQHNGDGARHSGGAPLKRRRPIGETSLLGLHRAHAAPDPRHSMDDLGKGRPDDQPRDQPSKGDVEPDIVESPYNLQRGLVVVETSSADDSYLAMDISSLCSQPSPQVLITATASKGLWDDEYGQVFLLHEPLEYTENTLLGCEVASDGKTINVLQPQLSIRTTDAQTAEAFEKGVYSPWVTAIQNYGTPDKAIIDGFDLVRAGFFVTGDTFQAMESRLVQVKVYQKNFDVTVEYLDYGLSVQVTYSIIQLPPAMMAPRPLDMRLGYFSTNYIDLGVHESLPDEKASESNDRRTSMIWRYNLEASPAHQIPIYVDPSVPERWRPYFKDGIESWNVAFEKIGYSKALVGVLPGDNDWPSDYDAGDARFNTISWSIDKDNTYSMGIARVDPRTGEILNSKVIFGDGWVQAYLSKFGRFESTQTLNKGIRREGLSFTQRRGGLASNIKPRLNLNGDKTTPEGLSLLAQVPNTNQTEAIGQGLKDVVTHEVGHILGLRHNFKGSMSVGLECTRNMSCSAEQGLSASVMDYLPMNVPSQGIGNVHLWTPVIGGYDILAIKYGYIPPAPGKSENSPQTRALLQEVLAEYEQQKYQFCTDEEAAQGKDPTCQMDDLSSDPIGYYRDYLKQISDGLPKLLDRYVAPGSPYTKYGDAVQEFLAIAEQIGASLSQWVGGISVLYTNRGYDGSLGRAARLPIAAHLQKQALETVFSVMRPYSSGLVPVPQENKYLVQSGVNGGMSPVDFSTDVRTIQEFLVDSVFNTETLNDLYMIQVEQRSDIQPPAVASDTSGLTCDEFLDMLVGAVFGNSTDELLRLAAEPQEWHLQLYLAQKMKKFQKEDITTDIATEVVASVQSHMINTMRIVEDAWVSQTSKGHKDTPLQMHLLKLRAELKLDFVTDLPDIPEQNSTSQNSSSNTSNASNTSNTSAHAESKSFAIRQAFSASMVLLFASLRLVL